MATNTPLTERWLALSGPDLAEHVRQAVRGDKSVWATVGAHPVLAARVAGALSTIQAQMVGHRDQAMWTMWINQAKRALSAARAAPATEPARKPAQDRRREKPRETAEAPAEATADVPVQIVVEDPEQRPRPTVVTPVTFLAPER